MARDSRSWKLTQETHVVLKKYLDVVNAVFQHGQAIDAHAERETADFFRVVVHEAVHSRVHHARAEKLDPARALALGTIYAAGGRAAPSAENAGDIELHGRLGEGKIARAEASLYARAEELLHEILDGSREIAKRNVRINGQAFHLMKNERVRGIGIVAAVDLARDNHADGRLALLHGANLHRRSVRAEKQRLGRAVGQLQIKGVHVIADRMEFGNI